mgnify:CR=1 FL=1
MDEHSVAHGTPRDAQSPETASPTRAVSSAEGTTKTGEAGSSKVHDGVRIYHTFTSQNYFLFYCKMSKYYLTD